MSDTVKWDMSRTLTASASAYMKAIPKHNKQPYYQKAYTIQHPDVNGRSVHGMRQQNTWNCAVGEPIAEKKPQYSNLGQLDFARSKRIVCYQAPSDRFAKPMTGGQTYGFVSPTKLKAPLHPIGSSPMTKYFDNMIAMKGKRA
eukprot:g11815.t1